MVAEVFTGRCRFVADPPDADLREAQGAIARADATIDTALLDRAPRLRVIARTGVGVERVDLAAPTARGIAVVVTPGTGAIAVAEGAAAREGATLVLAGRNAGHGKQVAAELAAAGAEASYVRGTLLDTTEELFDRHIAVNLRAPCFLMQAAVADMKKRGAPGTIVNIISIDSHGGQSSLAPYVAAKAGLAGLTRNAAHAPRWDRIRINGLNMGWSATDGENLTRRQSHGADADWQQWAAAALPMGKLGQVDEIADFVAFLLSDRSGVVTGSVIDWDQNVIGGLDD